MPALVSPLTDARRGRLVAREYVPGRGWRCVCDCGGERYAPSSDFDRGSYTSCGCLRVDKGRARRKFDHARAAQIVRETGSYSEAARQVGASVHAVIVAVNALGVFGDYKRELNHNYFARADDEQQAYWLGFLAADGCVTDGNKVCLCLAETDRGHVEAFRSAVGSTHAIVESASPEGRRLGRAGGRFVGVSFRSDEMTGDLAKLGIVPRKSLTAEAWDGPADLMRHYWRGVIDGDGWVCAGRLPCVGMVGSKAMVEQFRVWGEGVTRATVAARQKGKVWEVAFSGSSAKAVAFALYADASVCLSRKRLKADSVIAREFRPVAARRPPF